MATTRLTDVYTDPNFTPTEGPVADATTRAESTLAVLRSVANKSPAHRARYEAAKAALKKIIESGE